MFTIGFMLLKNLKKMNPNILTKDLLRENKEVVMRFIKWFNSNNKTANTNMPIWNEELKKTVYTHISIDSFFDLDFAVQLGYYLEWIGANGVYVVSYYSPLDKALILKLVYTKDKATSFHYHDLEEVNTSHFTNNPLEAYELLIAMFITKLNFPF